MKSAFGDHCGSSTRATVKTEASRRTSADGQQEFLIHLVCC